MRTITISMLLCIALAMLFAAPASADTKYIYGIHDLGYYPATSSTDDMVTGGVNGWIVHVAQIGRDPDDYEGFNFTDYANSGYTIICRLDNTAQGNGEGTIPNSAYYRGFAQRCANFVRNSPGCHFWIIGNEPNDANEWPTGQPITVERYVTCYNLCYDAIKALPGHVSDIVCPAAIGTYNEGNAGAGIPPYNQYYFNMLSNLDSARVDGIVMHVYTHDGPAMSLITDMTTMSSPPFDEDLYYHFRAYRNYIEMAPTAFQTKPFYITEAGQYDADGAGTRWASPETYESGWVQMAYSEINEWNTAHPTQMVRCLSLYRWGPDAPLSTIYDREYIRSDWRSAMTYGYYWTTAPTADDAGRGVDAGDLFTTGLVINPKMPGSSAGAKIYTGTLYSPTTDTNDYYKFWVVKGQTITVSMTSPSGSNFYLRLYNASGATTDAVLTTAQTKLINRVTTTATGYWAMRCTRATGSGKYTFSVTVNKASNATPTGTNHAADTHISVDTTSGSYVGSNAVDDNTATYWMSTGDSSTHYFKLTFWNSSLGTPRTRAVKGCIIKLASAAGLSTAKNLKRFTINNDEFIVDNAVQAGTITCSYAIPKPTQSVRLDITDCGNDNFARITDIQVLCDDTEMTAGTPGGTNKALYFGDWSACSNATSPYYSYKAFDGVYTDSASKWMSQESNDEHWLWAHLAAPRNVRGYVVYHAGAAGESTSYNTRYFQIDAGTIDSPECSVDNSAQANVTSLSYTTPRELTIARVWMAEDDAGGAEARIPEFQIFCDGDNHTESFETAPAWTSVYPSSGDTCTWSRVATSPYDGSYCLQASRSTGTTGGTSIRVKRYTVTANTCVTIRGWTRCPEYTEGAYLVETAVKVGSYSATDFATNPATWKIINRFCESGVNGSYEGDWQSFGNNEYWPDEYWWVNTMSETTISVAYKHVGIGCAGPTVWWDYMLIN